MIINSGRPWEPIFFIRMLYALYTQVRSTIILAYIAYIIIYITCERLPTFLCVPHAAHYTYVHASRSRVIVLLQDNQDITMIDDQLRFQGVCRGVHFIIPRVYSFHTRVTTIERLVIWNRALWPTSLQPLCKIRSTYAYTAFNCYSPSMAINFKSTKRYIGSRQKSRTNRRFCYTSLVDYIMI